MRGVLRSTTAGDPDPNNNVTFTDLTFDAQTPDINNPNWLTQTTSIHPDQHALVFDPRILISGSKVPMVA